MNFISSIDILEITKNSISTTLWLYIRKNPNYLEHNYCYVYSINDVLKIERLLLISGLEYNEIKEDLYYDTKVYLYSISDFKRYIAILRLIYKDNRILYSNEEVESFYGR